MVIKLSEENFREEVLESDIPVLIDFRADWCGPCRVFDPLIEEIGEEAQGFKVGSVDVDESRELALRYNVMSIPTVAVFKNGAVSASILGIQPKERLLGMLEL